MTDVRRPPAAGQDPKRPLSVDPSDPAALAVWRVEAHDIIENVRLFAFDAAAPRGARRHARRHLRSVLRTHLRALEARIDAIAPMVTAPPAS
jgi:hypothetical protein